MSSIVVSGDAAQEMPAGRLLNTYVTEAKFAFVSLLRNPGFVIPTLAFPTFFYFLIGIVFGLFKSKDPNAPMWLFCGLATMGAMTPGMFGLGIGFAMEREHGLYNLKRAWPMPPLASLFGYVAMSIMATFCATAILMLVVTVCRVAPFGVAQMLAMLPVVSLGSIPFCALGLLIGSMATGRAAPAIANVLYILMLYLSGILIPLRDNLSWIPVLTPGFYLDQLVLAAAGGPHYFVGSALNHVGVMLGVTVLCLGLAARRLKRIG